MPDEQKESSNGSCDVCRKPAKQLCSSCKAVFYCSKDCQKRGWKDHKTKCRPFTLVVNSKYGRHLVATREIKAGEVLLREMPMLVGPKQKSGALCLGCHRPARETRCSKCHYSVCGPSCQTSKYHKDECEALSRGKVTLSTQEDLSIDHPAFACITALRCLLTKNTDQNTWDLINTMQDHAADIKKGDLYQFFKVNVVDQIRKTFNNDQFSEDEILRMCGILTTNAFEVRHNGSRVRGLYNFASKLAHSCVANTKRVFEDDLTVVFISTVRIPKGELLTTNYSQVLWNTMARRQHLKLVKFFLCECPRCSDPSELGTQFSTLLCDQCGAGVLSKDPLNLEAVWGCSKCPHIMSAKQVRWGDAVLYRELREIGKGSSVGIEHFMDKYKATLHPQNRFLVEAKYALVKMYGNTPNCRYRDLSRTQLESKVNYCRELLELGDVLDPGLSVLRGSIQMELQAGIVALAKHLLSNDIITHDGAKDYMEEAAKVLQEASLILKHEPELRDGGLNQKLAKLAEELEM